MADTDYGTDNGSGTIYIEPPVPQDFENYLPYACKCLEIPGIITVIRQVQRLEYSSANMGTVKKSKFKAKSKSRVELSSNLELRSVIDPLRFYSRTSEDTICIIAYYDTNENLIHLKFYKNKQLPCTMFKLLGLIVRFYNYLTSITVERGLNQHNLKELNNFLKLSNVTDICLDNTIILKGEYHILLQNKKLRQLSLRRCNINDFQIKEIAFNLHYSEQCSTKLVALNLGTNKITDEGAKYLASALRSNRCLSYLNLCDNMITDDGAIAILDTLTEFPLTVDEILSSKRRYFTYLKERARLVTKILTEIKSPNPPVMKKKKSGQTDKKVKLEESLTAKSEAFIDDVIPYEVATAKADKQLGEFIDPFSNKNTILINDYRHCTGNARLCILNLAYNKITLVSINKLIAVLKYQKSMKNKKYTGLFKVNVDGNHLPNLDDCVELQCASELLQNALYFSFRKK